MITRFIFIFLLCNICFSSAGADTSFIKPVITFIHGGYDFCDPTAKCYLELSKTELILFNEIGTWESRINTNEFRKKIGPGKYRILIIGEDSDSIEAANFEIPQYNQAPNIFVKISNSACCLNYIGKYLMFLPDSVNHVPMECYNLPEVFNKIIHANEIEIIGVISTNSNKEIALRRTKNIEASLIEMGIEPSKITISIELFQNPENPLKGRQVIYPEDMEFIEKGCEVGIVIKSK